MSFEVVASSRIEQRKYTPWQFVAMMGGQFGIGSLFLAFVGIFTLFNQRPIIVETLTLGYATAAILFMIAGIMVARRRIMPDLLQTYLGGMAAGAIAAAMLAVLAIVMNFVALRFIFVMLHKPLFDMLTFKQDSLVLGLAYLLVLGAASGAVGVFLFLLPERIRRPVALGLVAALLSGLFQELIRPVLASSGTTKWLWKLLYTWTGLTLQGAIIVFVAVAFVTGVWMLYREGAIARWGKLEPRTRRNIRWTYWALVAVLAILFPIYAGNFIGQVFLMVGLFILMGMGLNLEIGLAGLLDLGFVAFYAVGAYTTALLMANDAAALAHLSFWFAMPLAVLASIIVGVLFGVPVLKVRGDYLAVATLGLGEIVRVIVLSDAAAPLLAGSKGILQIPRPQIGDFIFNTPVSLFYLTLVAALVAAYFAWRLENSRLGRAWTAIRDDEDVAQALGINLIKVKLLAYGLGAAFAGLAGSIFAVMLGSIYPHSFQLIISINILALIIVGGMGSLPGVAVGAFVLIGLPEALREFGEFRFLFYGLAIIAVMRLKPEGLWPSAARKRELQYEAEAVAIEHGEVIPDEKA